MKGGQGQEIGGDLKHEVGVQEGMEVEEAGGTEMTTAGTRKSKLGKV